MPLERPRFTSLAVTPLAVSSSLERFLPDASTPELLTRSPPFVARNPCLSAHAPPCPAHEPLNR